MLEKRNRIQWRKLMHRTYTFTPASIRQRFHPASKVIVEPRLCFSSCLVHRSLSYVWQYIPKYCNFFLNGLLFAKMPYPFYFSLNVVLDMLHSPSKSFKFGSPVQPFSDFCISPWQMYLWCLNFLLQYHFYPLPFFVWTGGVSKWWNFSIPITFQIICLAPIG